MGLIDAGPHRSARPRRPDAARVGRAWSSHVRSGRASCSTARPSTPAAAASRRTTACCCGRACRPASSAPARATTSTSCPPRATRCRRPARAVRGAVEDERRTALMRTHSGLHVLCGVVFRDFGALVTGGNMEPGEARMDFNLPEVPEGSRTPRGARQRRGRRRPGDRGQGAAPRRGVRDPRHHPDPDQPDPADEQEIVGSSTSSGLDAQADGGTHVASTRQIGGIEVVKVESKGKGFRRLRIRIRP